MSSRMAAWGHPPVSMARILRCANRSSSTRARVFRQPRAKNGVWMRGVTAGGRRLDRVWSSSKKTKGVGPRQETVEALSLSISLSLSLPACAHEHRRWPTKLQSCRSSASVVNRNWIDSRPSIPQTEGQAQVPTNNSRIAPYLPYGRSNRYQKPEQTRAAYVFSQPWFIRGDKANTAAENPAILCRCAKLRGSPPFLQGGVLSEKLGVFPREDVVRHLGSVRPTNKHSDCMVVQ